MANLSSTKQPVPNFLLKRICEGGFILLLTAAGFILLALSSYQSLDPGWTHVSKAKGEIANAGGQVGAYVADGLYYLFGYIAYLLPIFFGTIGWFILKEQRFFELQNKFAVALRAGGFIALLIGSCGLFNLSTLKPVDSLHSAGGILGDVVASGLDYALGSQGAILLLLAILLVGITLLTGLSWVQMTESLGFYCCKLVNLVWHTIKQQCVKLPKITFPRFWQKNKSFELVKPKRQFLNGKKAKGMEPPRKLPAIEERSVELPPSPPAKPGAPLIKPMQVSSEPAATRTVASPPSGRLPSLSLLDKGRPGRVLGGYTHQELETLSRDVEQHLLDFGIQADVVAVHPGPVITRFELQLAAGIKVSKLSALAKDLARSLSVISVRVVEVIPGKTVVGIELPNQQRDMVFLSQVLSADVYQQAYSPLTLALGVDIAGYPMVVDLAKMPHLLVAGTTGSGKSVGINAMILSLLFKCTPEEVRLIMVDPKMLELSVYDGIPHLLTPVVTDMKEAASALRWCVGEMERRYRLMAALGVRNLSGFNTKVTEAEAKGEMLLDPLWKPTASMEATAPSLKTLPYVVVIIDELADMMMVVGKKVEQLIARIAQKARAAGIHLILATQRPSVDVLTGLIKSNIPTRISFQVSSKIDSRTILDQQGAEQLLGHGDLLFLAPGSGAPLRVHGAFVDDKEVHRVADDWRARGVPEYIDDITQGDGEGGFDGGFSEEGQDTEDTDPLYDQAVEFVLETRKASISAVQRRFKIGYNRAARLVDEMERTGIVGPLEGGFRDVLVSVEE